MFHFKMAILVKIIAEMRPLIRGGGHSMTDGIKSVDHILDFVENWFTIRIWG